MMKKIKVISVVLFFAALMELFLNWLTGWQITLAIAAKSFGATAVIFSICMLGSFCVRRILEGKD